MTLEEIGEGNDTLLCLTNYTRQSPYTGDMGNAIGNWYFPNGSRVLSSQSQSSFYRTRSQMAIRMNHRRDGVEGIYHCEIRDAMNVTQTIYIGVYSASTGEWSILFQSYCVVYAMCCVWVHISQWYTQLWLGMPTQVTKNNNPKYNGWDGPTEYFHPLIT